MKTKNYLLLIVFFIVLTAIVWGSAITIAKPKFVYNYNANGLLVQSNEFNPITYFAELGNKYDFIVSPEMHEEITAVEPYVFNAANTLSVVLNGNDKNVTLLVRVLDSGNNIAYCLSNFADVKVSEQISKEACIAELASPEKVKILIDFPDEKIVQASALLEENQVTIKTKDYSQLRNVSFIVARIMFENAESIIEQSNTLIDRLLSGGNLQ